MRYKEAARLLVADLRRFQVAVVDPENGMGIEALVGMSLKADREKIIKSFGFPTIKQVRCWMFQLQAGRDSVVWASYDREQNVVQFGIGVIR